MPPRPGRVDGGRFKPSVAEGRAVEGPATRTVETSGLRNADHVTAAKTPEALTGRLQVWRRSRDPSGRWMAARRSACGLRGWPGRHPGRLQGRTAIHRASLSRTETPSRIPACDWRGASGAANAVSPSKRPMISERAPIGFALSACPRPRRRRPPAATRHRGRLRRVSDGPGGRRPTHAKPLNRLVGGPGLEPGTR